MHLEFMPARQCRQHADVEHAAGLVRKPLAQPHVAPALGLRELSEVLCERVGLLIAGVDVGGAEHFAPNLGALSGPFCD